MNFSILLKKGEDNDATHEYLHILTDAIAKAFGVKDIKKYYSITETNRDDVLIIISPQTIVTEQPYLRKHRFIYWFQGVVPEEVIFLYGGVRSRIKAFIIRHAEKYILKNALQVFFVSEKLHRHYASGYGYKKDNYIIMPCFNQRMNESHFTGPKYERPTFVYAGNMARWQCPEKMVELFAEIKEKVPEATLTILTSEQEKAHKILAKYQVSAEVNYIPLQDLPEEMAKYKYGLLLREKMIINEVATPTKMNSYMASGVIPVLSDSIGDFREIFLPLKYIVTHDPDNPHKTVDRILEIEKQGVDAAEIKKEYRSIFQTYYNREAYVSTIADTLRTCFPEE
jgi:glycosyltransferase involved in cell wall biosynthesis